MSPIIEKEGRLYLDRTERIKLHLIWLSCKNFSALSKTENQALLKEAWANVKRNIRRYFRNYATSLGLIINAFKKINLTIDPNLHYGYDPEKDVLIFNLWSLFFSLTSDEFATPTPPWQTAGVLIHEFDHYLFFRESSMIGKTEKNYDEFNKEHLGELEKRAFHNQVTFLEKCKKNVPCETLDYKIRIRKWSADGKTTDSEIPVFRTSKNGVIDNINQAIRQYRDVLLRIEAGRNYDDFSTKDSIEDHSKMVDLLSLPIKLGPNRKNYPKIEVEL